MGTGSQFFLLQDEATALADLRQILLLLEFLHKDTLTISS